MLRIWCRDHHRPSHRQEFCPECQRLWEYATRRLERCVFGPEKPTCANCPVHCYERSRREQVRAMMRYAGPRMLWQHPILAIRHLLNGRRSAPPLPGKSAVSAGAPETLSHPS